MQNYYTIDVCHNGHWYQWELVTTREAADRLFEEYIDDETFDDVSITLHTDIHPCYKMVRESRKALKLRSKSNKEELPW